jgi:hypothetical protein
MGVLAGLLCFALWHRPESMAFFSQLNGASSSMAHNDLQNHQFAGDRLDQIAKESDAIMLKNDAIAQEPPATQNDFVHKSEQSTELTADQDQDSGIDVIEASEQMEEAMNVWNAEKIGFYRDELGMEDSQIAAVHELSTKTGNEIQAVVGAMTSNPPKITSDDFQFAIDHLKDDESQAVKRLVGDDKHRKMIAFREKWNSEIDSRFGIHFKVTGF